MKVRYTGNSDASLRNGEIYEVTSIERTWYRIVDDTGEDFLFSPDEFEIVENGETIQADENKENHKSLYYLDALVFSELPPDELDKEIKRLEEESKKLTEWPVM